MRMTRFARALVGGLFLLGTTLASAAAEPEVCVAEDTAACPRPVDLDAVDADVPAPAAVDPSVVAVPDDATATPDVAPNAPRIPRPVDTDVPTPGDSLLERQTVRTVAPVVVTTDIPSPGGVTRTVPASTNVQPFAAPAAPAATENVAPMPVIPLPEHLPPGPPNRLPPGPASRAP